MKLPTAVRAALLLALAVPAPGCGGAHGASATVGAATPRDVRLPGITLHTVEMGRRRQPVRLVVHGGFGLDHTYLRPWLDPLAEESRLVYVDLRGHGRSSAPPDAEGYTLSAAADDLAALVHARAESSGDEPGNKLGNEPADEPVDIIAHDLGAAVAVALAARHPEVVRRMVLVAPLRDAGQLRDLDARARSVLGDAGWQRLHALYTPQGTLRDLRALPALFREHGALWWHHPPPEEAIVAMTRTMAYRADAAADFQLAADRWDARLLAPEVRAPVLVITGDDDRTYPPDESRALADALPHGRFAVVAGAGHLPFVEAGAEVCRLTREFLGTGENEGQMAGRRGPQKAAPE